LGARDCEVQRDELAMQLREQRVHSAQLPTMQLVNTVVAEFEDLQVFAKFWHRFVRAKPWSLK
jgi:hypothetical protein